MKNKYLKWVGFIVLIITVPVLLGVTVQWGTPENAPWFHKNYSTVGWEFSNPSTGKAMFSINTTSANIIVNGGDDTNFVTKFFGTVIYSTYVGGTASQSNNLSYIDCVTTFKYTSGGTVVTFSAPFNDVPAVAISVIPIQAYDAYTQYSPQIFSLTSTGCTIRCNFGISSTAVGALVGECSTAQLYLSVKAIGK